MQAVHTIRSPAKVNIGLNIVGRTDNGYHELESLFWPVDLCDELSFQQSENLSLQTSVGEKNFVASSDLPSNDSNLVLKALRNQSQQSFSVKLQKNIPIGAGLGGGSSNAGSVLRFLNLSSQNQKREALSLGADVPFFLDPRPAWISGIGEKRADLSVQNSLLEGICFFLVLPPFSLSTAEVFQQYRLLGSPFSKPSKNPLAKDVDLPRFLNYLKSCKNDLEEAATVIQPKLAEILARLREFPSWYAGLSGSGSTCYAIIDRKQSKFAKELSESFRPYFCKSVMVNSFVA